MAKLAPDSDSDYGYDLSAEDELSAASLIDRVSTQNQAQATAPVTAQSSNIDAALGVDLSLLSDNDLSFDVSELDSSFAFGHRSGSLPASSPRSAPSRLVPSVARGDAQLAESVDRARPRTLPVPLEGDDISYPDLSGALSKIQDLPSPELDDEPELPSALQQQPKDTRSPLLRFRSFPKKPFSVSDLTAGAWCELQYWYTLTRLPRGKRTRTEAMKGGSKVHKKLEDEVHTTVEVEIEKLEDAFGLRLWNIIQGLRTLREMGITRELEVWGFVDGNLVNGVIDGLSYDNPDPQFEEEVLSSQGSSQEHHDGATQQKITNFFPSSAPSAEELKKVYLMDVKTRGANSLPSGAAVRPTTIQLFLYHRFLSDMAADRLDYSRMFRRYALDQDESFSDSFLAEIGTLHDEVFEGAGPDSASKGTDSDYVSASSDLGAPSASDFEAAEIIRDELATRGAAGASDLLRYRTLRELVELLRTEMHITFPNGADSIGDVLSVEYRKREPADGDGDAGGGIIGTNMFYFQGNVLDEYLAQDMMWWKGERPPRGVDIDEASYKCRSCEFAEVCEWRQAQDAERVTRSRRKTATKKKDLSW